MNLKPEEQQPQPPPQYPPQGHGPPYYQPYPPPKRDDKKIVILLVIVIIVIMVVPMITAAILYSFVRDLGPTDLPPSSHVPVGAWGDKTIMSPTEVWVDFGWLSPAPRPVDLQIILRKNDTDEARYYFVHDRADTLDLVVGIWLGTMTYVDLADNQLVDMGDQLRMTGLAPNSDYLLRMIYYPTGDQITMTSFSTPA
ncbi:MAG: hypothetical protein KAR39_09735 [Thermoplasmata archaeon]|nr:hypothetical protein [Thermoplasmata archaeon]